MISLAETYHVYRVSIETILDNICQTWQRNHFCAYMFFSARRSSE